MGINRSRLLKRIQAARGQIPCDRVLTNAPVFNVFSAEFEKKNLGIYDGTIVSVTPWDDIPRATEVIDLRDRVIVPGLIDAHVHLESTLLLPNLFEKSVVPRGTTTAICDPHEIANVMGTQGISYFCDVAEELSMDLRIMVPSCVPATHLETNGAGILSAGDLAPFQKRTKVLGLAEVMNVPAVINGDPAMFDKLEAFDGFPLDGHAPQLHGNDLSAYLVAGIQTCHESCELSEAREKLEKGMAVWIREGSVAKDLDALMPLISLRTSTSLGFCTDDRNPIEIQEQGHLDYLVRECLRRDYDPAAVFRASSWSVARLYGLDRGIDRIGAIAPGYRADLLVLGDVKSLAIDRVMVRGRWNSEIQWIDSSHVEPLRGNSMRCAKVTENDLKGPTGSVHVIRVIPGKIVTEHLVAGSESNGIYRMSVIERHGQKTVPANGYVTGFGNAMRGAIATSVGHDSHNLAVVGSDLKSMTTAANALIESGGGFCVARGGDVLSLLPLPIAGLMTETSAQDVVQKMNELRRASHEIGCELDEPFLQLAFLSLPVIPKLKLTNLGLVDVEKFELIPVAAQQN